MEALSDYAKKRLLVASEMLSDAKWLLANDRLSSAADRAYYAMFHAAQAALAVRGVTAPRSHRGLRTQFGKHPVLTGVIEREYSRDLALAHQLRQESSYEIYATPESNSVSELVTKAGRFVERIEQFVAAG